MIKDHSFFALPQGQVWSSLHNALPGVYLFFALLLVPASRLSVGRIVGRKAPRVPSLRTTVLAAIVFLAAILATLH